MSTFDTNFRLSISTAQALGYDEPDDIKKDKDDIISDLDYQDRQFEGFLSGFAQSSVSTGAWVVFTPTITGTGWDLGDGTLVGERVYNGNSVTFITKFTMGPLSVAGIGALAFALPATADGVSLFAPVKSLIVDLSSGERYGGSGEIQSTLVYAHAHISTGADAFVITGRPITFSTGDVIAVSGTYKRA